MLIQALLVFFFLCVPLVLGGFSTQTPDYGKARFVNSWDKIRLCYEAKKQLKEKRLDRVCLYCGSFQKWQMTPGILELSVLLTGRTPSIFVPSANKGIDVIGVTGSGKTFSAIEPLCASAIEQGLPLIVYDAKGKEDAKKGHSPFLATLAFRHKYNVRIFAPGQPYSCVINPLDSMRDKWDINAAQMIAENFHDNLRGEEQKTDGFFAPAAKRVVYGSFCLAKGTPYPDLLMAFCILSLKDLEKRLRYAKDHYNEYNPDYNFWYEAIFSQLLKAEGSDKTLASILTNADDVLASFMRPDIVPCIIGKTNTSLRLVAKELLILQSDDKRQTVVNPLLASVAGLSIGDNFEKSRKIPIIYSFDEKATFKVDGSPNWVNIYRSEGYASIYGAQSIEQYFKMYGKNDAAILRNTCGTRMWFKLGSASTAQEFTNYLGKKLTEEKNKTISYSGGRRTVTISKQKKTVDLVEPQEWLSFLEGGLVYINTHLQTKVDIEDARGSLPWRMNRLPLPKSDFKRRDDCIEAWDTKLSKKFIRIEEKKREKLDYDLEIKKRKEFAEKFLPLPPVKVKK